MRWQQARRVLQSEREDRIDASDADGLKEEGTGEENGRSRHPHAGSLSNDAICGPFRLAPAHHRPPSSLTRDNRALRVTETKT